MPLQTVRNKENKILGYRWGSHGRLYTGKGAKAKALKQGRAIEFTQRGSKK